MYMYQDLTVMFEQNENDGAMLPEDMCLKILFMIVLFAPLVLQNCKTK